ncbi:hypothetical protein ACQEVZ_24570 [Dactylosporangium sp. CA-152071]|uniref:hypothetical protein n=1 Tax=Dactylosporangium sp. CA-152071 TaxID=3239933 RepID=UPI003D92A0F0
MDSPKGSSLFGDALVAMVGQWEPGKNKALDEQRRALLEQGLGWGERADVEGRQG